VQVFHKLEEVARGLSGHARTCVAIGNFDGVHLGHAAILRGLTQCAQRSQSQAVVLTFFPHPVEVLRPGTKLERLTTTEEKLELLQARGLDAVLVENFNAELATLSAEVFFEKYLVQGLRARNLSVGYNFRFGKDRQGDTALLTRLCQKTGIELSVQAPFEVEGEKVSSSGVRLLLAEGDTLKAARWLGRPYRMVGSVTHGDQRGGDIGFPTANLKYPSDKLVPKTGVYVTRALWQKQSFASVTNIGVRPTFYADGQSSVHVETHLIDFQSRLYDERIEVEFLGRIRDEMRFPSVDALKQQIAADVAFAKKQILSP